MEIQAVEPFIEYYEKVRYRTNRLLPLIPEDKFEWSYQEGKFSFGDLIRHLAGIERYMYAESALFKPSQYPGHELKLAPSIAETLQYFNRLHQESMEIFSRLTIDDLNRKTITPAGTQITLWKWLRLMIEHEIHHRGQLYMYLAILNVTTPPMYGLTSEQVLEISNPKDSTK